MSGWGERVSGVGERGGVNGEECSPLDEGMGTRVV